MEKILLKGYAVSVISSFFSTFQFLVENSNFEKFTMHILELKVPSTSAPMHTVSSTTQAPAVEEQTEPG
jgi:hypothetical protein